MAAPVATDDLGYTVNEDQVLKVNSPMAGVLNNDTDADNDSLGARLSSNPRNPLFDFKTNGTFVYDARYHGTLYVTGDTLSANVGGAVALPNGFDSLAAGAIVYDTFTYKASDGLSEDEGLVRIAIVGVNDAPIAVDDSGIFDQGTDSTITLNVLANDTDVDVWPTPDTKTIVALKDLSDGGQAGTQDNDTSNGLAITTEGGTVTLVNGQLVYDANAGFFGIDTFEYTVSDGKGGTDVGLVRVTVLPANVVPTANDDQRSVGEDAGATAFATVLGNDSDPDDTPFIGAYLAAPIGSALRRVNEQGATIPGATGTLADFNSDGTFTYNPAGAFNSLGVGDVAYVAFDYVAYDGHGETDTATVRIQINGQNDNPGGTSPGAVSVYEAGLANGSGDGPTTTVQDIDISITDPDATDTPFVAGTTGGSLTALTGSYGNLTFVDANTVRYTLTSHAAHAATQGHNGGIQDNFTVYVVDEHGGFSGPLTVTVNVIDDINFLAVLPVSAGGTPIGTLDTLDDRTVNFTANATVTETFTLIAGADGQELDIVGKPANFTLADGRVVTSNVVTIDGHEAVRGTTTTNGVTSTFYELTLDPAAGTGQGSYTLKVFESPPVVINPVDFSSVSAGGPQEILTAENISFNGGFFTPAASPSPTTGQTVFSTFTEAAAGSNSDDINPNNAGGIGIGNGNIERLEALVIDVSQSTANVSALEFVVQGVGGGIGTADILWAAVKTVNGVLTVVDTGSENNINFAGAAQTVRVEPDTDFDFLYVALDPADVDGNDKVRINQISTVEEVASDDIVLGFRINSDDGDGDQSPAASANPSYEEFLVTVLGAGTGTINTGIIAA